VESKDAARIIQSFLDGTSKEWEWDDFISIPINDDPFLEEIRKKCAAVKDGFPSGKNDQYCNEEGVKALEGYIQIIKQRMKQ
jgi:hypothetical protein